MVTPAMAVPSEVIVDTYEGYTTFLEGVIRSVANNRGAKVTVHDDVDARTLGYVVERGHVRHTHVIALIHVKLTSEGVLKKFILAASNRVVLAEYLQRGMGLEEIRASVLDRQRFLSRAVEGAVEERPYGRAQ